MHGPPPECPIGLEPIALENVALFPCCTNVFDKRNKEYLGDMCPMCRAPLTGGLLVANNVVSAISNSNRPAAAAAAAAGEADADADADADDVVGDEQALIRTFKSKAANEKHQGSLKAVVSTINTFLTYRPKGARILLAFACDGDERHGTRRTRRTLQQELPKMDTIETVGYNKDSSSVRSFVTESDYNRVLIINTNNTSLSLEGLDLWNAQLIIMDKLNPGYLTPANMVQAIGRIMRPQFEVYIPGSGGGTTRSAFAPSAAAGRTGTRPSGSSSWSATPSSRRRKSRRRMWKSRTSSWPGRMATRSGRSSARRPDGRRPAGGGVGGRAPGVAREHGPERSRRGSRHRLSARARARHKLA